MVLEDAKAGFHFIPHTYTITTIRIAVCSSCGYMDTESEQYKNEVQRAREQFFRTHSPVTDDHPGNITSAVEDLFDEDDRIAWEKGTEESTNEADLVVDPKDARVCRRCGTTARRKRARFCSECGNPLSPDASDPAIFEPMLAALHGPGEMLNPLQAFREAITDNITPPLARELLDNVIIAVRDAIGERATWLDIRRFLTEKDFRDPVIDAVEDHQRKRYLQDAFTPGSRVAPND